MKKPFLLIGLFLCAGLVFAARKGVMEQGGDKLPRPQMYTSEAVYYSTTICNTTTFGPVVISSVPGYLFDISITSSQPGAWFQVLDARTPNFVDFSKAVFISSWVAANVVRDHIYEVGFSSGLSINNQPPSGVTGPAACIDIIYSDR